MSPPQKVLFICKEDNCGYSEILVQDRFLHTILVRLRNDNIRNELRPLLKNSLLAEEDILANLMLPISDEQEHFQNFHKKNVNINSIEPCDAIPRAIPLKPKSEYSILVEIRSLKTTLDSISSWKDTFEKCQQSRLPKLDTLHHRCPSCHQNYIFRCIHCFYCGSHEHLLAGCLKKKQDKKNKKN